MFTEREGEHLQRINELIERVIFFPMRLKHGRRARQKHGARAAALKTVTDTLRKADKLGASNIRRIYNVGLYLLLLDQDIADFTDEIIYANGEHRRRFIAKHEAILLYEA